MKEGSILLVALLLTAGLAWWSAEHPQTPPAPVAPAEAPPPVVTPGAPLPEQPRPAPPPPPQPTVRADQAYRCLRGGTPSFSDRPCAPGEVQEIIALHAPPPGTPTASYREQYDRLAAARPAVPSPRPSAPQPDEADLRAAECEHWATEIRHLDAAMRQPQTGPTMDRLAASRRAAHGRRFALGC